MRKISTKIALMTVLMVIITGFITAKIALDSYEDKVLQAADDQTKVVVSEGAAKIDTVMTEAENLIYDIIFYIQANADKDSILEKDLDYFKKFEKKVNDYVMQETDKLDNVLTTYVRYVPKLTYGTAGIFYTADETGLMSAVTPTDLAAYAEDDYEHVGWFYEPLQNGKASWLSPYYNANIDANMISYVVPFYINDQYFGVAGIDFSFDYICSLMEKEYNYKTGNYYIYNENSEIIFADKKMVGKNIKKLLGNDVEVKSNEKSERLVSFKATFNGKEYTGSNYTLSNNWVVGAMPTSAELKADFTTTCKKLISSVLLVVIIMCVIAIIFGNMIAKPITKLINIANHIADGNLTEVVNVKRKDEVSNLGKALNTMSASLRGIIGDVANESRSITSVIGNASGQVDDMSAKVDVLSNVTDRLYSGMDNTTKRTSIMKKETSDINSLLVDIEEKTEDGFNKTHEISKRAEELRKNAEEARDSARKINEEINESLQEAIEESKSIEEIRKLSKEMFDISFKTKLLSINAAIEASKAGESGKGFNVVAEEISSLATNSTQTVDRIQAISSKVINAVKTLNERSTQALDFIQNRVVDDYENTVLIGEQYYKDAEYILQFIKDFKVVEERLQNSMDNMLELLNEITTNSTESVEDTESIVKFAREVSTKMNNFVKIVQSTKDSCNRLTDVMDRFTL